MSKIELQLLFELTGGLPLLLETFVQLFASQKDPNLAFPALCDIVAEDAEVTASRTNIRKWDKKYIDEKSTELPELWKFYKCASLGVRCSVDSWWYDHRYLCFVCIVLGISTLIRMWLSHPAVGLEM